ncbi:MAG: hypothetical protein II283_08790 [Alistipes sp.]|nr:hypothetical protein [Alistipes sp.]
MDEPAPALIREGYRALDDIGAVAGPDHRITKLGRLLSSMPVDPHLGKMLLEAKQKKVLAEMLVITAFLSIQDPAERPFEKAAEADNAHRKFASDKSDFLGILTLWNSMRKAYSEAGGSYQAVRRFAKTNYYNYRRLREWENLVDDLNDVLMKHLDIELPREFITRFLGENSTPSNIIEIPTLAEAIGATGKKFEYILFDACFMANVEALYDLRNSSKYIVASLCEIMGKGFPYEKMIPYLLQNKGKSYDLAQAAKSFYEYYKQVSQSGGVYTGSIAVVDCSQLDALANAMRKVNQAIEDLAEPNKLQTYDGGTNHLFFDLGDYVNQACKDQTNKQAFEQQLRNTVVTKFTLDKFWSSYINANFYPVNTEVFSGLTTSAPSRLCRESYPQTAWYKATH